MSGTVNISRTIWEDAAFKPEPLTEREAFMWMIMEASYKPRERRIGSVSVHTDRGQLAASVRFMSEAWGWSKSRVDRYLKRLEKRDMIGTEVGTSVNLITICKYDDYQNTPKGSGTGKIKKRDSSGTVAGQQRDKPNTDAIPEEIRKEDTDVSSKGGKPPFANELSEAIAIYNEFAERVGWPQAQKTTSVRRTTIEARLKDCGGIEGWRHAMERAAASDFLCGRNDRAWHGFSLDWVRKQSNFTKLMEGNYDDNRQASNSAPSGGRETHAERRSRIVAAAARGSTG